MTGVRTKEFFILYFSNIMSKKILGVFLFVVCLIPSLSYASESSTDLQALAKKMVIPV